MGKRVIIDAIHFNLAIERLCHQLIENHKNFENTAIIGVQPRGIYLANRLCKRLKSILNKSEIKEGKLDITFYRDDFRKNENPLTANETRLNFSIEEMRIILVDDVLYTGRTIRAALDALLGFGRPKDVELLVLIDRRLQRHLPIQAKYVGKTIDSITNERVLVEWKEQDETDKVWIIDKK